MKITIEFDTLDAVAQKVLRALASVPPEGLVVCCDPPTETPITVWAEPEKISEARAAVPLTEEAPVKVETAEIPAAPPLVESKPKPKKAADKPKPAPEPTLQTPPPLQKVTDEDRIKAKEVRDKLLVVLNAYDKSGLKTGDLMGQLTRAAGVMTLSEITAANAPLAIAEADRLLAEIPATAPAPTPAPAPTLAPAPAASDFLDLI